MLVTLYKVELKNTYYDMDIGEYERNLLKELGYTLRKDPSVTLGVYNKPSSLAYGSDEYKDWDDRRDTYQVTRKDGTVTPFFTQADYPQWEHSAKTITGFHTATFTPDKFSDVVFMSSDRFIDIRTVSRQTIQVDHPLEGFFNDFSKTLAKQLGKELIKMTKGE